MHNPVTDCFLDANGNMIPVSATAPMPTTSGGGVASGATDSGNPVKVAGVYNSPPPTFTAGQRADLQTNSRGDLKVTDAVRTVESVASFVRPADTTAYASGDLIANSTTAGSVVAMTFAAVNRTSGQGCAVRRARIARSKNDVTGLIARIHLFTAAPTVTNGDNGVFLPAGPLTYLGALEMSTPVLFSDGAAGVAIPLNGGEINARPATTQLFGLLESRGAIAPASGETWTVTLELVQD